MLAAVHGSCCSVPDTENVQPTEPLKYNTRTAHAPHPAPRKKKRPALSYLQCIQLLQAALQLTGVLPQRLIYIKNDHVGAEPLLIASREFLQILVPFVRCDDRTTIAEKITPHMLARRAVAQIDRTQRMLKHFAIVADQGC